jgi:hypothetical protein
MPLRIIIAAGNHGRNGRMKFAGATDQLIIQFFVVGIVPEEQGRLPANHNDAIDNIKCASLANPPFSNF